MLEFSRCETVAQAALQAIRENRPFSIIRMGDGENSVFQYPDYCCEPRIQAVFRRALEDRKYTREEIISVKADMIKAMQRADVVGFYDSGHVNVLCRVYSEHLEGISFLRDASICVPSVHFYLQQSGYLRDLIREAEHVTLITGRDVLASFRDCYPDKDATDLRIPAEKMFRLEEEEKQTTEPHFPDVYERIKEKIAIRGPKHLFLIGAGILGKAYCDITKERGGIAIDIGSVFDYWANIPTREGYVTVKSGQLALEKPPYRPAMTMGSDPIGSERATQTYEAQFNSWEIAASPDGMLPKFKVARLAMLAKWVGAPFENGQAIRNYLPIGAAVAWTEVRKIADFAFIGDEAEVMAISSTLNFSAQNDALSPYTYEAGKSDNLAIFKTKRDFTPDVDAEIRMALNERPQNVFFIDFRLHDVFKELLAGYCVFELKLSSGTDFGTHAGFVYRAA